jgi:hypothetical protein
MKRGPALPMLSTGSLSAHPFMFNLFILLCIYYKHTLTSLKFDNRDDFLKKITVSLLYKIKLLSMNCHFYLLHLVCQLVERLQCFFEIFHESIKNIRGKDENFARLC